MQVKPLEESQVKDIYERYMPEAFPPGELKPWWAMERLLHSGQYFCYGLFAEEQLVCYGFYFRPSPHCQLLDYLAVLPGIRSRGYGSVFLQQIAELQKDVMTLGEVENPAATDVAAEKTLRMRRIGFYERNGFRLTLVRSCLFGVKYWIMVQNAPEVLTDRQVYDALTYIYQNLFPVPPEKLRQIMQMAILDKKEE